MNPFGHLLTLWHICLSVSSIKSSSSIYQHRTGLLSMSVQRTVNFLLAVECFLLQLVIICSFCLWSLSAGQICWWIYDRDPVFGIIASCWEMWEVTRQVNNTASASMQVKWRRWRQNSDRKTETIWKGGKTWDRGTRMKHPASFLFKGESHLSSPVIWSLTFLLCSAWWHTNDHFMLCVCQRVRGWKWLVCEIGRNDRWKEHHVDIVLLQWHNDSTNVWISVSLDRDWIWEKSFTHLHVHHNHHHCLVGWK